MSFKSLNHRDVTFDDPEAFNSILRFKPYIYEDSRNPPPVYIHGANHREFTRYHKQLDRYQHPPLHLTRILDIVALTCISEHGQVAATAASIQEHNGSLETTIYVAYDREAPPGVAAHIENVFTKLRGIPGPQLGLGGTIPFRYDEQTTAALCALGNTMYKFGWDLWLYYLRKRQHLVGAARKVLDEARLAKDSGLTTGECDIIKEILKSLCDLEDFITQVEGLTAFQVILHYYTEWDAFGYMKWPEHTAPTYTALDRFEALMQSGKFHEDKIYFPLTRWLNKIASFHINTLTLFMLSRRPRLQSILQGSISVVILSPPPRICMSISFSRNDFSAAVDAARKDFHHLKGPAWLEDSIGSENMNVNAERFLNAICQKLELDTSKPGEEVFSSVHQNARVHVEAYLACYLKDNNIPTSCYLGVSKPSCATCDLFLKAAAVIGISHYTGGAHQKSYPSWLFPSFRSGELTEKVRVELFSRSRGELARCFLAYVVKATLDTPPARPVRILTDAPTDAASELLKKLFEKHRLQRDMPS